MLYITRCRGNGVNQVFDVLDTDDMTLETISKIELCKAVASGSIDVGNLDKDDANTNFRYDFILTDDRHLVKGRKSLSQYRSKSPLIFTDTGKFVCDSDKPSFVVYCSRYNQFKALSYKGFHDIKRDIFIKAEYIDNGVKLILFLSGDLYEVSMYSSPVVISGVSLLKGLHIDVNGKDMSVYPHKVSMSSFCIGYRENDDMWALTAMNGIKTCVTMHFYEGNVTVKDDMLSKFSSFKGIARHTNYKSLTRSLLLE